jgi:hypothetical protein
MQPLTGQLKKDEQVVADNLQGRFEIEVKRDGTESWTGFFNLPSGVTVNVGEQYDLVLTDGRSKKVEINRVNAFAAQTSVGFVTPI